MKHIKLAIALLLLAALILSACHAPSPDPAETTPPTETTPAETTTTEATPAETEIDIDKEWGGTILTNVSYQGSAEQVYQQIAFERENVLYTHTNKDVAKAIYDKTGILYGFYYRTFAITSAEGIEKFSQNDDPWMPKPLANLDISKYNDAYFESNHLLVVDICTYFCPAIEIKFNSLTDKTLKIDIIQTAPTKAEMKESYPYYPYVTDGWTSDVLYCIEIPGKLIDGFTSSHTKRGQYAYNQIEYTYSFAD